VIWPKAAEQGRLPATPLPGDPPGQEPVVGATGPSAETDGAHCSPSPLAGEGRGEGDRSLPEREREFAIWQRISDAAKALNEQRERCVNPREWIDAIARAVDLEDDFSDVPEEARQLIRQSAIMAKAARHPDLKKRTLTNLYNERPTWLSLAHLELDRAVLAAYAAIDPDGVWSEDWAEVWRDSGAGQPLPDDHPLANERAEVDQQVLANLLRLNLARAKTAG